MLKLIKHTKERRYITAYDQFVHSLITILDSKIYKDAIQAKNINYQFKVTPMFNFCRLSKLSDIMVTGVYMEMFYYSVTHCKDSIPYTVRTFRFLSAVKRTLTMYMPLSQYKEIRTNFLKYMSKQNPYFFHFVHDRNRVICDLL